MVECFNDLNYSYFKMRHLSSLICSQTMFGFFLSKQPHVFLFSDRKILTFELYRAKNYSDSANTIDEPDVFLRSCSSFFLLFGFIC